VLPTLFFEFTAIILPAEAVAYCHLRQCASGSDFTRQSRVFTYIADFTNNIGEVFDLILKFCINSPQSPCRKHLQEFIDFAAGANRTQIDRWGVVTKTAGAISDDLPCRGDSDPLSCL
jgi:hypothetical protein